VKTKKKSLSLSEWNIDDVADWLQEFGLKEHISVFTANAVDGEMLLTLTDDDLKNELKVEKLLHRRKITSFVQKSVRSPTSLPFTPTGPNIQSTQLQSSLETFTKEKKRRQRKPVPNQ